MSALQEEVADLRMKCNSLLRETENIREGKEAEIKKVLSVPLPTAVGDQIHGLEFSYVTLLT